MNFFIVFGLQDILAYLVLLLFNLHEIASRIQKAIKDRLVNYLDIRRRIFDSDITVLFSLIGAPPAWGNAYPRFPYIYWMI